MEKMMINALFFVVLLIAMGWRNLAMSNAESPSYPPAPHDCYSLGFAMSPCLDYCKKNSTEAKPTPDCCTQVAITLKYNATCFCGVLSHAWEYGFNLNETRGMMIPPLCGFPHDKLPPAARCNETSPPPSRTPTPVPSPPPSSPPPRSSPPPSSPPPPSQPSTPPRSSPTPPSTPSPPPSTTPSTPAPTSTVPTQASNATATPAPSPKSSAGTFIVPSLVLVFIAPFLVV